MAQLKLALVCVLLCLTGCQSAYYSAMEKVGIHKRDILVDNVEEVQAAQKEVQQEVQTTLEKLNTLTQYDGGELQTVYESLNDRYQDASQASQALSSKIQKVEDVAGALFDEWQLELEEYSSHQLKQKSAAKLRKTRLGYQKMLRAMRKSEQRITPVLTSLKDNVLYLKHNLNASAINAIQGEFDNLKRDIKLLMKEMNQAISESNQFIAQLEKGEA